MPTYCYRTKKGKVCERVFSVKDDIPKSIMFRGEKAERSFADEMASTPASAGWPMECCASGVHPDQAGALRKEFQRVGVPTEVTKGGDPIYTSASHRRKALRARGLHDRNSFN